MPALLSKTDLLSFAQCARKLWLERRRPDLEPEEDAGAERRKREGLHAGAVARSLLGPNIVWPKTQGSKDLSAVHAAAQLQASPGVPGVEVPLYFDDVYARVDALLPTQSGAYILQETKASTFPLEKDKVTPAKLDHVDELDAAIQLYLAENMGYQITEVELNFINNRIPHPGGGDYSSLFRASLATSNVRAIAEHLPQFIEQAREALEGPMPVVETGSQCKNPHGCQFLKTCEAWDPPKEEHPITLLPDSAGKALAKKIKGTYGHTSITTVGALEWGAPKALPLYLRMQQAHKTGVAILEADSGAELVNLPYPRYYFDFEGIDLAVPVWEGVRPYEQIPYQWSCHIEHSPGKFSHVDFLDLSGNDPSIPCIERMLKYIDLKDNGPIFVYHATYEKGRLVELAQRHPEYLGAVEHYVSRLVDLLPMVKNSYYHPDMKGSFSIKKVLPTIAPDLDYAQLDDVTDGVAAQNTYVAAALERTLTADEFARAELNSLIYCQQDTWAMVEVAYFLQRFPRPDRGADL